MAGLMTRPSCMMVVWETNRIHKRRAPHWPVKEDAEGSNALRIRWVMTENVPKNSTDKDKWLWEAGRMGGKKEDIKPRSGKHLHSLNRKEERIASVGEQLWQKHKDIQVSARYASDWGTQKVPRCTAGIYMELQKAAEDSNGGRMHDAWQKLNADTSSATSYERECMMQGCNIWICFSDRR